MPRSPSFLLFILLTACSPPSPTSPPAPATDMAVNMPDDLAEESPPDMAVTVPDLATPADMTMATDMTAPPIAPCWVAPDLTPYQEPSAPGFATNVTWSADTPSGSASPSAAQTVGRINVTNHTNADAYTVQVEFLPVLMYSTFALKGELKVYKDNLGSPAIGSCLIEGHPVGSPGFTVYVPLTNTFVSDGSTKQLILVADTTNATAAKNLSIRLPMFFYRESVYYLKNTSDLPLPFKTFTY